MELFADYREARTGAPYAPMPAPAFRPVVLGLSGRVLMVSWTDPAGPARVSGGSRRVLGWPLDGLGDVLSES